MRKLSVSLKRDAAMVVSRVSVGKGKLVYVLVADKRWKYRKGRSHIVYIGSTKQGIIRITQSVAARAEEIVKLHGVRKFDARVLTCGGRQHVKTWLKLERALLIRFRDSFGEKPKCNTAGKRMPERDEFAYFRRARIDGIIRDLS